MARFELCFFAILLVVLVATPAAFGLVIPTNLQGIRRTPIQFSVVEKQSKDGSSYFNMTLSGLSANDVHLNLVHPESSTFAAGFTFGTTTALSEDLRRAENDIVIDKEKNAVLIISKAKGQYRARGWIAGASLVHNELGNHFVMQADPNQQESTHNTSKCAGTINMAPSLLTRLVPDFGSIPQRDQNPSQKPLAEATVEVQVVVDTVLSAALGNSRDEIAKYMAVTFHAVNNVFASMSNPTLGVKLAGIYLLTAAENEKIIVSTGYNLHETLYALRDWENGKPSGLGPNDVVAMFVGVDLAGGGGVAWVGQTCGSYKVSVNVDKGAFWLGVNVAAHEIGHTLGGPHDFDTECGEEGFIMGYEWGSTNKWRFSECSKVAIRQRVGTSAGSCLYTDNAGIGISLGNSDPGDVLSFDAQCEKRIAAGNYGVSTGHRPQAKPEEACLKLTCGFRKADNSNWLVTFNMFADGTSCNQSGGWKQAALDELYYTASNFDLVDRVSCTVSAVSRDQTLTPVVQSLPTMFAFYAKARAWPRASSLL